MIERIDWQEIKKLAIFLAVVLCVTLVLGVVLKGGTEKSAQKSEVNAPRLAEKSQNEKDKALDIEHYEVYSLRDPFTPLAVPDQQLDTGNLATTFSEPAPLVEDVYVEKGKEMARLNYQGKPVVISQGQKAGNFKAIDIIPREKIVIFIYGDQKVVVRKR